MEADTLKPYFNLFFSSSVFTGGKYLGEGWANREKRFQGGGHAGGKRRTSRAIKIKKRGGKHRVEEWATEFHMTELEHPVLPGDTIYIYAILVTLNIVFT